ncbi:MAG: hypothetical protein K2K66_06980, partial [Ruminococcus sp.]|nr:hypothetical protein [Ruminococcus sp.]
MPEKPSVEDILDEYFAEKPEPKSPVATATRPVSHEKNAWDDNTLMNEPPPQKRSGRKITVLNGAVDEEGNPTSAMYNNTVINTHMSADDVSKIRRMTESTRAREAAELQKSANKRRKKEVDYTYKKETPEGEYMYTPPVFKKKKRSREAIIAEAEDPENLKLITDIVPSPAIIAAAKYSGRKSKSNSKINYHKPETPEAIDVRIDTDTVKQQSPDTTTKKRTKRIVDFNYYGDVEDVGRD